MQIVIPDFVGAIHAYSHWIAAALVLSILAAMWLRRDD